MKKAIDYGTFIIVLAITNFLFSSAAVAAQQEGARITLPIDRYEFGVVAEGALVTYDFEINNAGNAVLSIKKALSSCSCLTINSFNESISPGESGTVSVSLNTNGYGGNEVVRQVTIQTNDPESPQIALTVSGRVDKIFSMTPEIVKLRGRAGDPVSTSVTIFPEENYDFEILGVRIKKGKYIECSVQEICENGQRGCMVTVESTKSEKGLFFDKIFLDTDSAVVPEIVIGVFGKIEES